jgi:hypothetical protein
MKAPAMVFACVVLAMALPSAAQQKPADISGTYWNAVKAEKRKWVEQNMMLSAAEAKAFWPLYDHYQKDLAPILKELKEVIEIYADHYRKGTLSDSEAQALYNRILAIEERELVLRRTFFDWLSRALSARVAARYLQLESRMMTVIRFELAQNLPLAGDTSPVGGGQKK